MGTQAHLTMAFAALAAVAGLLTACSPGEEPPAWTMVPQPPGSPTAPATVVSTASPSPTATSPAVSASPAAEDGLTAEELLTLTGGTGTRIDTATPTQVTREQAVSVVRTRFPGDRPLIWDGLVTYGTDQRVGWMVVLGIAPDQACPLHAGLLDRALEGGIVDATQGTIDWTYVCG